MKTITNSLDIDCITGLNTSDQQITCVQQVMDTSDSLVTGICIWIWANLTLSLSEALRIHNSKGPFTQYDFFLSATAFLHQIAVLQCEQYHWHPYNPFHAMYKNTVALRKNRTVWMGLNTCGQESHDLPSCIPTFQQLRFKAAVNCGTFYLQLQLWDWCTVVMKGR